MSQPQTVPLSATILPAQPDTSKAVQFSETSPTLIQKAKDLARAKLLQRNRHQRQLELEFPITLNFEASTIFAMQGFTPHVDSRLWRVKDVTIRISGKRGSTTTVCFEHVPGF